MSFRRSFATVCSIFVLETVVIGQPSDWQSVLLLQPGVSLGVELFSGVIRRGQFVEAGSDRLAIRLSGKAIEVPRASVRRLSVIHERTVGRFAVRGAIIGATAGAVLGVTTAKTNKMQWSALMAVGWGAVGAFIGSMNGLASREELIYRAPMP
jgi:hypothetical protein